nr:hypothetical protein GCM10020185_28250 [Pseudomonas brassicacearum subsp. brassicacearum]
MNRDSRYLESILHHDIPLTRDMGLKVLDWQARQLRLSLPLAANVNHKSTMFGGSLYCGAVLGGWGWLHLALREEGIEDGHIVIQEGQISYPLPVTRDATVVCEAPEEKGLEALPGHLPTLRTGAAGVADAGDEYRQRGRGGAV